MGAHGTPWDSVGPHGIPWDPMGSHRPHGTHEQIYGPETLWQAVWTRLVEKHVFWIPELVLDSLEPGFRTVAISLFEPTQNQLIWLDGDPNREEIRFPKSVVHNRVVHNRLVGGNADDSRPQGSFPDPFPSRPGEKYPLRVPSLRRIQHQHQPQQPPEKTHGFRSSL